MNFTGVLVLLDNISDNSEKNNVLRSNYHLLPNIDCDQLCQILSKFKWVYCEYGQCGPTDLYRKETVSILQKKLTADSNIDKIFDKFDCDKCKRDVVVILREQIIKLYNPLAIALEINSDTIMNEVLTILIEHITSISSEDARILMRFYAKDSYRVEALGIMHRKIRHPVYNDFYQTIDEIQDPDSKNKAKKFLEVIESNIGDYVYD